MRFLQRPGRILVVADDDAARVQVVVQRLRLAQELRTEQDIVRVQLLADVLGVADRDRRFDDDRRLVLLGSVLGGFQDEFDDGLHCGAVKEVLLRVVVGRRRDNDEVCVSVCGRSVGRCLEIELTRSVLGFL